MALKRLGHRVHLIDAFHLIFPDAGRIQNWLHYRTGYKFLSGKTDVVVRGICDDFLDLDIDIVWINGGELFNAHHLCALRSIADVVLLYNNDDPTGKRDGNRFEVLRKSIPFYDACVVPRQISVEDYLQLGARFVIRDWMSYDEIAHRPLSDSECLQFSNYRSEVVFVGTWIAGEERDEFLLELISRGVPIAIWGDRWNKSRHFRRLAKHVRGPGLAGRDYVAAIQSSKVALGLLSHGNRDLHTARSIEVPYIGSALCAERTSEHTILYRESVDAMFWDDARECAAICLELLANDKMRETIRYSGYSRVRGLRLGNEDKCSRIVDTLRRHIQSSVVDHTSPTPLSQSSCAWAP